MKKQMQRLGMLRAVAAALLLLLAFPAMAGSAVGFDTNPIPRPDDSDKYKSIIEDADPVGTYWRGYYIPGAWRITIRIHGAEDGICHLPDPIGRLPMFVLILEDRSVMDLFRREPTNGAAERSKRRD